MLGLGTASIKPTGGIYLRILFTLKKKSVQNSNFECKVDLEHPLGFFPKWYQSKDNFPYYNRIIVFVLFNVVYCNSNLKAFCKSEMLNVNGITITFDYYIKHFLQLFSVHGYFNQF